MSKAPIVGSDTKLLPPLTETLPVRRTHVRLAPTSLCILVACLAVADPVHSQATRQDFAAADGPVYATARSGNTLYIGGEFGRVGPAMGGGVPLGIGDGLPSAGFPKVTGFVNAVAPDGSGGWYIGGIFSSVGGVARANLARILSNNTVASWDPAPNGSVQALAVSGGTIYAGGSFTTIGGQSRSGIAALDAATGLATAWDPEATVTSFMPEIRSIVPRGSTIYVGGVFSGIGGQSRANLAALDAASGLATSWDPGPDNRVYVVMVAGDTIYVGGEFLNIGGQARSHLASVSATTGLALSWNPAPLGGGVRTLLRNTTQAFGSTLFVGGDFTSINGTGPAHLAEVSAVSGLPTAWTAFADGSVGSLLLEGGTFSGGVLVGATLFVGGSFNNIGQQPRAVVAALNPTTALATAWAPRASGTVNALASNGTALYAGGVGLMIGALARQNLAAIDLTTGSLTSWNPGTTATVRAVAALGQKVYVGGNFSTAGGQSRNHIAAIDSSTGLATSWNPSSDGIVYCLLPFGNLVYAGGSFTSIGGQARIGIAALDPTSGSATSWNANSNGGVLALAVDGSRVYAGGNFSTIGGQSRRRLAALDAGTGLASAWNPNVDQAVRALALGGPVVYAGGDFSTVGGLARNGIVALDTATAQPTAWDPDCGGAVYALAVSAGSVYVGGSFDVIGGQSRKFGLAAIDPVSGLAQPWAPGPNGTVTSVTLQEPMVYVGGDFTSVGTAPQTNLAAVGDVTTPALLSLVSADATSNRVRLTWFSPDPGAPSAAVYRRTAETDWHWVAPVSFDGTGQISYEDVDLIPGSRYGYRLGIVRSGREAFFGEAWVEVPKTPSLSLAGSRPNPGRGDLTVAFSLPDGAPARISVLDMAGRRLFDREVGPLGAGSHVMSLANGGALAPGVYLVRLTRGARSIVARAAVVR